MHSMEWSFKAVLEWSIGVEWSQILEWQKYLLFAHKTVHSMEWSLGAEFWSGVLEWSQVKFWSGKGTFSLLIKSCILWSGVLESSGVRIWSGKSRMECTSQLHFILLLPLQNLTPLQYSAPRLHAIKYTVPCAYTSLNV